MYREESLQKSQSQRTNTKTVTQEKIFYSEKYSDFPGGPV